VERQLEGVAKDELDIRVRGQAVPKRRLERGVELDGVDPLDPWR
jgi:hypothetical protein